jgi:hypothetical protein
VKQVAGTSPKYQTPEVKPAPSERGLGEGAAGSPAAGGAPIRWIEVNLQDLYELGHIDVQAYKLLERILQTYNVQYEVIVNISPDVGAEYFVSDLDFIRKFESAEGWWHEEVAALVDYAKRRKAVAIVELFDGYETAFALVYGD